MPATKRVSRTQLKKRARQYLARSMKVGNGHSRTSFSITDAQLERIVEREVELTVRQLRQTGAQIVE